jgi:anti-anti-sigma factor
MTTSDLCFDLDIDYSTREIAVCGESDIATAVYLKTAVSRLQGGAAIGDITVRLDGVTFIAAGMGAVIQARSAQKNCGGHLALAGATARVQKMFLIAHLDRLLQPV